MSTKSIVSISIHEIVPGANDRTIFTAEKIAELAASIKDNGLIQPISVRPLPETDIFQIVAGERRFRAMKSLGWTEVPAIVTEMSDEEAAAVMLAENVARADLDAIDEARAYQSRMTMFGWDAATCADKAGVSATRVHFRLKLLKLREDVQALVRSNNLALGYAQILSDADLDRNFQGQAIAKLRENAAPTPGWFRNVVSELLTQQAQGSLFDSPLFGGELIPVVTKSATIDPPLPTTTTPPVVEGSMSDILTSHIRFWQLAADEWDRLGKSFKRQECMAAAAALQNILTITGGK